MGLLEEPVSSSSKALNLLGGLMGLTGVRNTSAMSPDPPSIDPPHCLNAS